MRLFALTVARNESDRYQRSMLAAASEWADEHFLYDDQSTDDTFAVALAAGCQVGSRAEEPSFLQHEGHFRQAAWDLFVDCVRPAVGDWVLAIDADEILVTTGTNCCLRCEIDQVIASAEHQGAKSVLLPIPEVFGIDEHGIPLVRTDGLWATIAGTRLFRFQLGGIYRDRSMGCGAEPTYVAEGSISRHSMGLHLLHYGYADPADQVAKHERYTSLANHGHLDAHVQSIIGPKTLKPWVGPIPDMRRSRHADRVA